MSEPTVEETIEFSNNLFLDKDFKTVSSSGKSIRCFFYQCLKIGHSSNLSHSTSKEELEANVGNTDITTPDTCSQSIGNTPDNKKLKTYCAIKAARHFISM